MSSKTSLQSSVDEPPKLQVADPEFFQMERVDTLEMQVLAERESRLNAEALRLQTELNILGAAKQELVARLSSRYKVDIQQYVIDATSGVAKRKART